MRLSFEKAYEQHPLASDILHFNAFLQPDAIPEELFQHDDSFKFGTTVFDEAIAALLRYSLLKRNTQDLTLSIHRLVQSVLIDTMSPDIRMQWRERVVSVLQAAFPDVVEFKYWRQCERLLPHALVCARWTVDEFSPTLEVADLFKEAGIYLRTRGQYTEAEKLHSKVHAICEQHFGVEHPYTAFALNNLALTYISQGKYEQAEPLLRQAVSIEAKRFGAGHPQTIMSLGNLAASYVGLGEYDQARDIYKLVISIWETQFGDEHPDVANSLCNLALVYSRQDKYEQAEPLLLRALSILYKQLVSEHPDIAAAQSNLAHVYVQQHKYDQAELLYQQAISIQEKYIGTLLPQVARNLYDLSLALYLQGKEAQAEAVYQRFVSIHEQQVAAKDSRVQLTERKHADFMHCIELAVLEDAAEVKAREANDKPPG